MRWREACRDVIPLMPDPAGTDFNDVVMKEDGYAENAAI